MEKNTKDNKSTIDSEFETDIDLNQAKNSDDKQGCNSNEIKSNGTKKRKSVREIFAKPSILRIVNLSIMLAVFILMWVMFFATLAGMPDPHNRKLTYAMCSLLMLAPPLIELVFRVKFSDFLLTFYLVYVIFAGILGAGFAFYQTVPYFDKVAHSLFGYVGCIDRKSVV